MKNFVVGVLGAGFGERVVIPCINYVDGIRLKYFYCRNRKNIKNKKNLKFYVNDYKKILKDKEINLIFIETPPYTHKKFLIDSIKYKKNVICEKPLASNLKDINIMSKVAKNRKNFIYVNHQLRFDPNIIKLRELIRKRVIGKINYINVEYHTNMIDEKNVNNWWFNKNQGGGQVLAIGSHLIDLLIFLNGDISNINSLKGNFLKYKNNKRHLWKKKIESFFTLICRFKNGSIGSVNSSCVSSTDSGLNITVSGEKGTIKILNFEKLIIENLEGKLKRFHQKDKLKNVPIVGMNPWRSSMVRFLKYIVKNSNNKKNLLCADILQAKKTQIILNKILNNKG
jgi:predicted dehydrogenase